MRSLQQSLQDYDHGHLRIIAELWGLDPPGESKDDMAAWLAESMLAEDLLSEIVEALPLGQPGLDRLAAEGGHLPWADFEQQYGELRQMGPGRRDREKPWRHPQSATEALFYRGLIGRAFADTTTGPKEFAYIPTDLQPLLPDAPDSATPEIAISSEEPSVVLPASSGLVDDATTTLAALRRHPAAADLGPHQLDRFAAFLTQPRALPMLLTLMADLELIEPTSQQPVPTNTGAFLEARRHQALSRLQSAWLRSDSWNDFALLDHLKPDPSGWPGEPAAIRAAVLSLVERLPAHTWIDLEPFLQAVRANYPSFLRPGADFDSWYLRDRHTGAFLNGPQSWPAVDGALLRAIITGPLHWLGAVDLGMDEANEQPDRFRLTRWAGGLIGTGQVPEIIEPEASGQIRSDGLIVLPRATSRQQRYQVARLCTWLSFEDDCYRYRLRPSAVQASGQQGVRPAHVRQLLDSISPDPVPAAILRALDRLSENGIEAHLERMIVLQVADSALLDRLIERPQTGRLIRSRLGPQAASVAAADVEQLLQLAASAGLLIEPTGSGHTAEV
ncbi:MAG: hypothetical protein WBR18_07790 [Anaerolineales bacterium]